MATAAIKEGYRGVDCCETLLRSLVVAVIKSQQRWLEANELPSIAIAVAGAPVAMSCLVFRRLPAGNALKPTRLLFPVANAAGLARPGLDARIQGLRVERVAVSRPGTRRAA